METSSIAKEGKLIASNQCVKFTSQSRPQSAVKVLSWLLNNPTYLKRLVYILCEKRNTKLKMFQLLAKHIIGSAYAGGFQRRAAIQLCLLKGFSDNTSNTPHSSSDIGGNKEEESLSETPTNSKLGGFAKAYDKFLKAEAPKEAVPDHRTFSELLRTSLFVDVS